ncbi:MAG: hypothetical protein U0835_25060 [Isosphaeraceae bacterium]
MIYLSDNDIVEKLGICDLLDDALAVLEISRSDVYVVPSLKYRFGIEKNRDRVEKRFGADAVSRILDFISGVQEIRDASTEDQARLDDIVGIDPGELVLLSATGITNSYRLVTGDKRCLKTIATHPECEFIARRIQGRVICFEQVLCRIIAHFGFEHVRTKVVPVILCDTALRAAFGSGHASTEENAVACLQSYVSELRGLPIDLLVTEV